jgi:hypothetical protein
MESSSEISRLCETWWGKIADSAKADQNRFAEQLLALLGWQNTGTGKSGLVIPFPSPGNFSAPFNHFSYILRGQAQPAVAAHFVMPGTLEPPALVTQRGLDFCEATRVLVFETAALNVDYAFITDLYRSYLYDVRTEDLLLAANTPSDFRRDLVSVLTRTNVERGSLEEIRRQPRSHVARQLREWCHHWHEFFRGDCKLSDELAQQAMDRLLITRYLIDHDILKRTGWRLRKRWSELIEKCFSSNTRGCGRLLKSLFHDIWFDWKADLFAPAPALDAAIEQDSVTVPLLKDLSLHSGGKFFIATILESFNYGDAAEKARVRMVPDYNEEREQFLAKQTLETVDSVHLEIDLTDEGYRSIFYWFDQLVALYDRLETEFACKTYSPPEPTGEMDLFEWSEMSSKQPQALGDKFQHATETGLVLYYSTPRQLRTGRLMLYLHLISCYERTGLRFVQFPRVASAFLSRPRILDTDRKWIMQGRTAEDEVF